MSSIISIDLNSITVNQGVQIQGASAGDSSGYSLRDVGDINEDGYNEIIIGAPYASPNGRSNAGTSYVIFGQAGGLTNIDLNTLTSSQGFKILGSISGDWMGFSVSCAGDVNGDGYADIIIGSYRASYSSRTGAAYVIWGKSSGFSDIDLVNLGTAGFRIKGAPGDELGSTVSGAGDMNGDGYADIVVAKGKSGYRTADGNGAYVIFGKANGFSNMDLANGLNSTQGFTIAGYGTVVASAGDINVDGYDDIIIGASGTQVSGASSDTGVSYVIFGKASGLTDINLSSFSSTKGFFISGESRGCNSGKYVDGVGDVNGDGHDDIVIASNNNMYIIFGNPSGFSNIYLSNGIANPQGVAFIGNSGWAIQSVSKAGDVNGDGYKDIVLSTYGGGNSYSYVIYGTNNFNDLYYLSSLDNTQGFMMTSSGGSSTTMGGAFEGGATASIAGDVNGDGYSDVMVGVYSEAAGIRNIAGVTYIVFGNYTYGGSVPNPTIVPTTSTPTTLAPSTTASPVSSPTLNSSPIPTLPATIVHGTFDNDVFTATVNLEIFMGNGGEDTVSYVNSISGVNANLNIGQGSGGYAQGDSYIGISDLIGSIYADTLIGNNNANNIAGGSGNDIIEGRGGDDILDGGDGTDTLSYANSPAGVMINLNLETGSGSDADGDTFTNFENIVGSKYNDKLTGNINANIIKGGSGNDTIQGNGGDDILYGESGIDTFKFTSLSGTVRIKDFNVTMNEKLDFSFFSELSSVSNLNIEGSGTSTQISFLNGEGQVILENVAEDQLTNNNFIFATQPIQPVPSWYEANKIKVTVVSSVLSGVAAIAGLAYTLYNCKKDGAYCFKKKIVEKVATAATVMATVQAVEEVPLKVKAWLFDNTQEQKAEADVYSSFIYDIELTDSFLD